MSEDPLLSIDEVCAELRISKGHMRSIIKAKLIQAVDLGSGRGSYWKIRRSWLEDYLDRMSNLHGDDGSPEED